MSEEDQNQLVSRLRALSLKEKMFLQTNTDWSHPGTEMISIAKGIIYNELADIIEALKNP